MSLLAAHLEQIHYSCQGIDSLPFPPPKIFTNALLSNHDITSLIRDTESHERALFSVPPPPPTQTAKPSSTTVQQADDLSSTSKSSRRRTVFNVNAGEITTGPPTSRGGPRRYTAVAAVLGAPLHEQLILRPSSSSLRGTTSSNNTRDATGAGVVDMEVILRGAEKLCGVYELPGARERIAALRKRARSGMATVEYYERKVEEQNAALANMSRGWMDDDDDDGEEGEEEEEYGWTVEDLRREEEEARELERRKRELQRRLGAMEKDYTGLMRI